MIEEIEPHPDLIKYFEITHNFKSDLSVNVFTDSGEHYNVLSNIDQNIFLLRRLEERGLLKETNSICDCGIGLGNALFEIYLQSLDIDKNFHFYGVEKQNVYVDFIINNLSNLWKDKLNLIKDDIMNIDYSNYNIIYSYSPFNNKNQLEKMYQKIINEIKTNSLIIENANYGRGHFNLLKEFNELKEIDLDGLYIYKKI
jgi:hypothetical protein